MEWFKNFIRRLFRVKPKKKNIIEGLPNVPNTMFHKTGVYKPKPKY